ncbi:hypothetical protein [Nostoc sp. UHCC 0252]|uniref:hypothetical protein n=1 Tax=Nostoc sp. UHCC 0252 TaxID=3110241 RepID=UPI002B204161|nr:hypothetical protein [Nostoc sp. UHCC 0252]MEA5603979.1 hypothetical protein [Nostoc sp. UHCC 0252]
MNAQGKIEKAWVEHGIFQEGNAGVKIHTNFSVENVQNVPCKIAAYFHKSPEEKLKRINSSYTSSDGQLVISSEFTPVYTSTVYNDFSMFIPYEELKGDGEKLSDIKFQICLYIKDGAKFFHWSKYFFVQPLSLEDLDPVEQEIMSSLKDMSKAKKEVIRVSKNAFIEWIKTAVPSVWNEISGKLPEIWEWVIRLFS